MKPKTAMLPIRKDCYKINNFKTKTTFFLPSNENAGKDEVVEVVQRPPSDHDVKGDIFRTNFDINVFFQHFKIFSLKSKCNCICNTGICLFIDCYYYEYLLRSNNNVDLKLQ